MTGLGSAWRYVRERGLWAGGRTLLNRIYDSRQYIIVWNLLAGPPAQDRVGDVVFRLATPSDLDNLDGLKRYGRGAIDRHYVEKDNDMLFVACHGERIVATRRYGRVIRHDLVARVLQLSERQLWSADIFCRPEYRNQGIPRHLGHFAERLLASRGYSELFGVVSVTNMPSLRSVLHKGAQPVSYLSYTRLLFYERLRVSKDIPRRVVEGSK